MLEPRDQIFDVAWLKEIFVNLAEVLVTLASTVPFDPCLFRVRLRVSVP